MFMHRIALACYGFNSDTATPHFNLFSIVSDRHCIIIETLACEKHAKTNSTISRSLTLYLFRTRHCKTFFMRAVRTGN